VENNISVITFEVRKDSWTETRIFSQSMSTQLAPNEVLFKVDRQALTANNISYISAGDSLKYWEFFPTEEGWGRVPGMGWSEVIASAHPDIQVGERVWGFTPFTTHHKILAGKVNQFSLSDVAVHRVGHAPIYCQFDRASSNPVYEQPREDQDSLLRGLFMTSWLVEDFIATNNFFDAQVCSITSASSKTSIALGHSVKRRGQLRSIGITSPGNVAFCESLGCYDTVICYQDITDLNGAEGAVVVDMAGNAKVLSALHHQYADKLMHSCLIGATHQGEMGSVEGLPGAKPQFFFAPTHVRARSAELGAQQLMQLLGTDYAVFRRFCDGWMTVVPSYGVEAIDKTYQAVLAGRADPVAGQIVSLTAEGE
jgi:hypothetical protein